MGEDQYGVQGWEEVTKLGVEGKTLFMWWGGVSRNDGG